MGESVDDIGEQSRGDLVGRLVTAGETETAGPGEPIRVGSPEEFADIVAEYSVALAALGAEWCRSSRELQSVAETVAQETPAAVAVVDVDEHRRLARRYSVRGVPTLVLFSDGETVEWVPEMRDEDHLVSLVREYV